MQRRDLRQQQVDAAARSRFSGQRKDRYDSAVQRAQRLRASAQGLRAVLCGELLLDSAFRLAVHREPRSGGVLHFSRQCTLGMPKTERWQWYVEKFAPAEQHHHAIDAVFYEGRSDFQQIAVIRSPVFGKMLVLDGDTQSAAADEKIYHEALVHPALAGTAGCTSASW